MDSWQDILGLHRGMTEKHREIMKTEGGEREKDCSVSTTTSDCTQSVWAIIPFQPSKLS